MNLVRCMIYFNLETKESFAMHEGCIHTLEISPYVTPGKMYAVGRPIYLICNPSAFSMYKIDLPPEEYNFMIGLFDDLRK